jgi:predicted nuclease of predicted toxin-antitoxin system
VKLLLDENVSHRLVGALQESYPGSSQVSLVGLSGQGDSEVWKHAREFDYVIVTKDDDFLDLAAFHGRPPVVIRLVLGNCRNAQVLDALLANVEVIEDAVSRDAVGVIELG